jgi:hypothetical protein
LKNAVEWLSNKNLKRLERNPNLETVTDHHPPDTETQDDIDAEESGD